MKSPIILYDDKCRLCMFFVKMANIFSFGKLRIVGHYTNYGKHISSLIPHSEPTGMFWLIMKNDVYGGRAALLALLKHVIFQKNHTWHKNTIPKNTCDAKCDVFLRSYSVLRNSAHFNISLPIF